MSTVEILGSIGLLLNVVVAVVGLTWGMSKVRDAIKDEIESHRIRFDDEVDSLGRSFGESISALREKVREVELFSRDTFVRRESFYEGIKNISTDLKSLVARVEARLERMEDKIDQAKVAALRATSLIQPDTASEKAR